MEGIRRVLYRSEVTSSTILNDLKNAKTENFQYTGKQDARILLSRALLAY